MAPEPLGDRLASCDRGFSAETERVQPSRTPIRMVDNARSAVRSLQCGYLVSMASERKPHPPRLSSQGEILRTSYEVQLEHVDPGCPERIHQLARVGRLPLLQGGGARMQSTIDRRTG